MKNIAYIAFFIGMFLVIANLTLTNSLASDGSRLGALSQERDVQTERIDQLRQEIMEAQSLAVIESRAIEIGFSQKISLSRLNNSLLANGQ